MLTPQLGFEWKLWILVNGLPAVVAALGFLITARWDRNFGWDVLPRAAGISLGIGFLMRAAMYVQQFTAGSYLEMRWLHWGNVVFAGVLLGATCVWGDQFKWRRLTAIGWLFLYIEEPVWMLTLWPRSDAAISAAAPIGTSPINGLLQGALFLEAAVMLVAGLVIFMNRPGAMSPQPDLMSARVLAGWPLSYVVWAPTLALAPTFAESRGGILVNMIWLAAWVVLPLLFRKHFDLAHRNTRIWMAGCAVLLVLMLAGWFAQAA
jgi:hypothetical protein